ncbi:YciI family protein [Maricurvus nonylphenolicus]|uniref:YciI family protein n=1 Tax=Maricurvus nonylphenolicus TaxID=1008307 RepID=UPI0036F3275D
MWYAIISEDVENSLPLRDQHRPQHVARLKALAEEGRLLVAGPHPAVDTLEPGEAGFTGSLIVADFDSIEAAQAWVAEDPYVINNVHTDVKVKLFKKVLP